MPHNHAHRQGNNSFFLYAVLSLLLLPIATRFYTTWKMSGCSDDFNPLSHIDQGVDLDGYISLCADLHNQLLAKTTIPPTPPPKNNIPQENNLPTSTGPESEHPAARFEKTLLERYRAFANAPPFISYIDKAYMPPIIPADAPILSLLSRLETTTFERSKPDSADSDDPDLTFTPQLALTPLLYQPIPDVFFPELFFSEEWNPRSHFSSQQLLATDCNCLLLYPQRIGGGFENAYDGGIFADMYTLRATWNDGSPDMGAGQFLDKKDWIGLHVILRRELKKWERGTYQYVKDENGYGEGIDQARVTMVKWSPYSPRPREHDNQEDEKGLEETNGAEKQDRNHSRTGDFPNMQVAEAIQQWDRLLHAIEAKMESYGYEIITYGERLPPILPGALTDIKISQIAKDFLTRARRPPWTFVAPGITTFTDESLEKIYSAKDPSSRRLLVTYDEDSSDWISLVLPSEQVVSADVKSYDPRVRHSKVTGNSYAFDKAWGFGQFTLDRRAGLYTMSETEWDGDLVTLVTPSGNTETGRFTTTCPWGPDRQPRLAELLAHWADLVESGVWEVDESGVLGGAGWFEESEKNSRLAGLEWRNYVDWV